MPNKRSSLRKSRGVRNAREGGRTSPISDGADGLCRIDKLYAICIGCVGAAASRLRSTSSRVLWAVSRAPLEKLQAYKRRMGWSFPWASSFGRDFNSDFDVYASEEQQRTGAYEYNYRPGTPAAAFATRLTPDGPAKGAAMTGTDVATYVREKPGMSAFALEDGTVYHTYSAYARGLDGLWGAYQWLDRAPKGRNETAYWWRRHDEYDKR